MSPKWYVLHVLTGAELEVQRQLREKGVDAMVIQETSLIRRGGRWQEETRTLFPGYVFVFMKYTVSMHYAMKGIAGAIRLLPKDKPQPLLPKETAWLIDICGDVLSPSKVRFGETGPPTVVEGPLKGLEDYIVRYDRHRRRVQLRIPVLGEEKDLSLSIIPV